MRRSIVVALLLAPAAATAQDIAPGGYTRMILGAGIQKYAPTVTVGVEHKKASARLGFRLMAELRDNVAGMPGHQMLQVYSTSRTYGLQALGIRTFRERSRFQPYVLAGLGVYHTAGSAQRLAVTLDSTGIHPAPGEWVHHRSTVPTLLWGFGANVRIMRMNLFGDLKLPTWEGPGFGYGPQAPLTFGIRF